MRHITLTANGHTFNATIADNETAQAFARLLPLSLHMSELNGNEKYHYLSENLPAKASCPDTIHAGDIMLYGQSCIVVFYKTFPTRYSYTRIGQVDDPTSLQQALGSGNVDVSFTAQKETSVKQAKTGQAATPAYTVTGTVAGAETSGIVIKNGHKYYHK